MDEGSTALKDPLGDIELPEAGVGSALLGQVEMSVVRIVRSRCPDTMPAGLPFLADSASSERGGPGGLARFSCVVVVGSSTFVGRLVGHQKRLRPTMTCGPQHI